MELFAFLWLHLFMLSWWILVEWANNNQLAPIICSQTFNLDDQKINKIIYFCPFEPFQEKQLLILTNYLFQVYLFNNHMLNSFKILCWCPEQQFLINCWVPIRTFLKLLWLYNVFEILWLILFYKIILQNLHVAVKGALQLVEMLPWMWMTIFIDLYLAFLSWVYFLKAKVSFK